MHYSWGLSGWNKDLIHTFREKSLIFPRCRAGSQWPSLSLVIGQIVDLPKKKATKWLDLVAFVQVNGRRERIRTFYPLHPI